ncbi:hypothetical protein AVEN_49864-1 [Araneus ventricosus]|uniref:CCHC-type domain-containing protein n=1 Tax=Araneus ventricosus TaxID=182803 RepID=A0A4Y2NWQ7_ARAVE|nr:hypothetical protein AVEN_49864-1 [Araneus ventricosus]
MNELGKTVTERELVRYIIEGLPDTFECIAWPLSTNRAIPLVDFRQTLLNFEKKNAERRNEEFKAYKTGDRHKAKSCYVCNKPGHLQKDCWFRINQNGKNFRMKKHPVRSRANGRNYDHRSEHAKISKESDKKEFAFTLHEEDTDALAEWHLDSACTSHMTPNETWLVNKKVENKIISVVEEGRNIESENHHNTTEIHWAAVKCILRYLRGTSDYCPRFNSTPGKLKACTDASWSTTADAKSCSGYFLKLGENVVDWRSSKQKLVALSTMESELIVACDLLELNENHLIETPTPVV